MMLASLLFVALGDIAMADLRWASWPKGGWKLRKEHSSKPYRHPIFPLYMEPSDFNYEKLKQQRARNYDNFLRSNIDNEQDNRNFDTEDGKDHLPFRSFETAATDQDQRLESDGGLSAMEISTRMEMSELQSPTQPTSPPASCWMHFPSNCSRHRMYASDGWKRDNWGEAHKKANVDENACLKTRKDEYDRWCQVNDTVMHYLAPLASAPPKPENPLPATCWTYMPTGCPRQHHFDGSSEWSRDYHGERHKNTGADENACQNTRKEELNNWCGVTDAETYYVKPLASAPPKPTSPPASCWQYLPTGCPKREEFHGASGWSRDFYGEERKKASVDENACLNTRKAEINNWCGVANAEMHFIAPDPKSTVLTMMSPANPLSDTGVTEAGNYIDVTEGEPYVVPLRWNNPHSAELEVNIWIMKSTQKYVVPIMRPTCSGEGYQNNVFDFKIPTGFPKDVCNQPRDCVLQVYAHSVESRMYASGTPIIVKGTGPSDYQTRAEDPKLDVAFDLHLLRPLCLSRGDKDAHHTEVKIYKARLSSDVYNHAYQNSDFSPYAGQQPQFISQNLQAACILKMTANNFGELGKTYMQKIAPEARHYAHKLDRKARHLIEKYEKAADQIINAIKYNVANNDTMALSNVQVGSAGVCSTSGVRYDPIGSRTVASNGVACQQRCLKEGKVFFNFWPNGGCHCSTASATERMDAGNPTYVSGSMTCDARILFQETAHCFRCKEVGSTTTRRHNTNTYIPSFEIEGKENINKALDYVTGAQLKSGFMQNPGFGTMTAMNDPKATVNIYMAALSDMWDEFKKASDGTYAATQCPSGQESVSEASCLEEARKLLPAGTGQGRTTLISGSWGHVPHGCSIQSGGDWAAHYNKHACGRNDGMYSLVCQAAGQATNQTEQTQEDSPPKECPAGQESVSEADCLAKAKEMIPEGKKQGRETLVTGRWGHVPLGCTLYEGDWAAHYNQNHCGSGHKQFKPICQAATGEKKDPLDKFKFTYRGAVLKTTTATLSDENGGVNRNYRKRDADDKPDGGYYSAEKAWHLQNRINGSSTPVPERAGPLAQSTMSNGDILNYPPLAPKAAVGCNASGASLMEGEDTDLALGILRRLSKDKRAAVLATIGAEPMPRGRVAMVNADGHLNVEASEKQRPHLMRTLAEGRTNAAQAPRPGLMRTQTPQILSPGE